MRRVRAIKYTQNSRVFYAAVIPAGDLVEMTKVDVWHSDQAPDDQGYQRVPNRSRKRAIAKYLENGPANPVMPTGGLLNARSGSKGLPSYGSVLGFEEEGSSGSVAWGWLTLSDNDAPLWVVDMQHRLGGFQHAIEEDGRSDLRSFPLLVTIADGLTKLEEVEQFELLNTTQKKVRVDLARRLMAIQVRSDSSRKGEFEAKGKLWQAEGAEIAASLNNWPGVWFQRIIPPDRTKTECPTGIIRETSFVTSLKPVLATPYFRRLSAHDTTDMIARYWEVIGALYSGAIDKPDEHVLQKTPGVFAFHMIAPEVFELARETGALEKKNLTQVLRNVSEAYGSEEWRSDNTDGFSQYGSMKGFARLAQELREELPMLSVK